MKMDMYIFSIYTVCVCIYVYIINIHKKLIQKRKYKKEKLLFWMQLITINSLTALIYHIKNSHIMKYYLMYFIPVTAKLNFFAVFIIA